MKGGILEETYELIKSLSKTEKRYFKLFARFQNGEKGYMNLFDIIDKQDCYDEKIIIRKFTAKQTVSNLPAVKKYLFDQVIASIKSYGAYKDLDSTHTDLIETYKVLQYKGLHGQSGRLLKKIKSVTLQDDAFLRHIYVLLLEYLREMFNNQNPSENKVKQILEEKNKVFSIIENYTLVGDPFSYQRLYLRKKLFCRTKKEREELTKLMKPVLKTKESDMLSSTALGLRSMGLCDYFMAIGKPEKAFAVSKTYLEIRTNSSASEKIADGIIAEHLQHLWLCVRSGIYDGFEENRTRFKTLIDTVKNHQFFMQGYERWYNYSFIYYNRTGQFVKALEFAASEKQTMDRVAIEFSIKAKTMLWYFTAYNHFARKDFRAALTMLQKVINSSNEEVEEFVFSKLLLMFIHYELKNFELLEYQVRSYLRMLQKTERIYRCEKVLVEFFKSASAVDGFKNSRHELVALKTKVATYFKSHYEKGFLFYFDLESWLESRLSGRDFAILAQNRE